MARAMRRVERSAREIRLEYGARERLFVQLVELALHLRHLRAQ